MSENAGSAKVEEDNKKQTGGNGKKRSSTGRKDKTPSPSLNLKELQELAELIDEHGFTDFEFENENIRVRMSKNPAPPPFVQAAQPFANPPTVQPAPVAAAAAAVQRPPETKTEVAEAEPAAEELHQITSPIVGTFYRAASPDKEPYVKEGSTVSPGTVVCIVEAMKLMNEIEAEVSGEVVKIYVENGQPVEFGQPLFGIRK